ncbi:unnamed protein product [Arabidopsis lyrata]|nr:unnamed protein product [Arabidopsis lyrata]
MAQHQHSPQRLRDQENTRPHELYGDVFSVSGDDDVARKQGVSFSQPDPTVATMGSADTVTIGEALEATALSLGDKPVDHKDAAAIQAAETRATGESMARPGGLAVAAQATWCHRLFIRRRHSHRCCGEASRRQGGDK